MCREGYLLFHYVNPRFTGHGSGLQRYSKRMRGFIPLVELYFIRQNYWTKK